jgi:hypothetical protein
METETPLMLLFVFNGTNQGSILSDTRQMLDLAYNNVEQNGMMPEEFENKDIPISPYTLTFRVSQLTQNRMPIRVMTTTRSKARRRTTSKLPRKRCNISSTCPGMLIA